MTPKKTKTKTAEELAAEVIAPAAEEIAEVTEEEKGTRPVTSEKTPEEIAEEAQKAHFRYMRELVAVTPAPPRMGEDPNYPIGINGKLWLLPKGKTSQVPRYVAMAYNQAEAARGVQQDNQAKLLERQSGGTIDLSKMTEAQIAQLKTILGIG